MVKTVIKGRASQLSVINESPHNNPLKEMCGKQNMNRNPLNAERTYFFTWLMYLIKFPHRSDCELNFKEERAR